MDMGKLSKRQNAVMAEVARVVKGRDAPAAMLARPLAVHATQADRLKLRIAALEEEKAGVIRRIEAEIAALQQEARTVEARLVGDRKHYAAAGKAAAGSVPAKARAAAAQPVGKVAAAPKKARPQARTGQK
jgi:hypothetical protein